MSLKSAFHVAVIWDTDLMFTKLIEDCGHTCESVTPHLLAAPFYRGRYSAIVVPTGFANPDYCSVLPAVRACSGRIKRFVENGGTLLVYGGGANQPGAYDWLPFFVGYNFDYKEHALDVDEKHPYSSIVSDYETSCIGIDGYLSISDSDAKVVVTCNDRPVMIEKKIGDGNVIVSCIHEYPSRTFIKDFCKGSCETLF